MQRGLKVIAKTPKYCLCRLGNVSNVVWASLGSLTVRMWLARYIAQKASQQTEIILSEWRMPFWASRSLRVLLASIRSLSPRLRTRPDRSGN